MGKHGVHKHSSGGKGKPHLHHHVKHHFKRGGKVDGLPHSESGHPKQNEHEEGRGYNAMGTHVMAEAHKTKDAFKHGGKVMGHKSKARMDKYARGGRAGGSPFSSAKIKENTAAK